MANRTYTDQEFIDAVNSSYSLNEVAKRLGLKYGGYQARSFRGLITRLELDASHMDQKGKAVFGSTPELRWCGHHDKLEPIEGFSLSTTGWNSHCKKALSEKSCERQRLAKYGLSAEQYVEMLERQGHTCAVCDRANPGGKKLAVDHDHACCPGKYSCGKCVRGLLCSNCNSSLGHAKDSVEILESMIEYLGKGVS